MISRRFEEIICEEAPVPRYLRNVSREKLKSLRGDYLENKGCTIRVSFIESCEFWASVAFWFIAYKTYCFVLKVIGDFY